MLTKLPIQKAKPAEKPYKLSDAGGLVRLVNPTGSKWWRLRYRIEARERGISLGVYPDVTLKRAREKRDEARKAIADDIDPNAQRQAKRLCGVVRIENVASERIAAQAQALSPPTLRKAYWMLESFVFEAIGRESIARVTAPVVLQIVVL